MFLASARNWMLLSAFWMTEPTTLIVKRYLVGNEQRLKCPTSARWHAHQSGDLMAGRLIGVFFPQTFRPIFPNGWADVAKREGFELPEESQEK